MKIGGFMLILVVLLVSCISSVTNQRVEENTVLANTQGVSQSKTGKNAELVDLSGVVTLSEQYSKNDFVRIYNEDGSLWYEYSYYYDDSDGKFEYTNENFKPFSFHPDYFVLAMRCASQDENRFEVIVNEETGLKKFVRKDDRSLKFETWELHIPKAFAVDFERQRNPVRMNPDGKIKTIVSPSKSLFHPVEVNGEWLKIRWISVIKEKKIENVGWVKWKENNKILVELYYYS
jgi:hypothetical protein